MQEFNKLVRDFVPDLIRQNGEVPECCQYDAIQFRFALLEKLIEESKKFCENDQYDFNGLLNVAADCKEVYDYVCAEWHVGVGVMTKAAARPRIVASEDPRQDLYRMTQRMWSARHDHGALVEATADYRNAFEIAVNHFLLLDKLFERQLLRARERGQFTKRICLRRVYTKEEAASIKATR